MKSQRMILATASLLVFLLSLLATQESSVLSRAQNRRYTLSWWTVDGGGGTSSGGRSILAGIAGQPEAGGQMSGARYTLTGGFWGVGTEQHDIYLPLILRPPP